LQSEKGRKSRSARCEESSSSRRGRRRRRRRGQLLPWAHPRPLLFELKLPSSKNYPSLLLHPPFSSVCGRKIQKSLSQKVTEKTARVKRGEEDETKRELLQRMI